MNFAELGAVVTVLSSSIAGAAFAHSQNAGWFSLLFAVGGLGVGVVVALAFGKLAFAALFSAKAGFVKGVLFFTYCLLPLASIGVGILATFLLTGAVLRLFQ